MVESGNKKKENTRAGWDRLRRELETERRQKEEDAEHLASMPQEEREAAKAAEEAQAEKARVEAGEREERLKAKRKASHDEATWGSVNPVMICPHCQAKGFIRTKRIEKKGGVSGSKAAGAVVTGGLSVLVTGLSAVDTLTQSHCDHCDNTWAF